MEQPKTSREHIQAAHALELDHNQLAEQILAFLKQYEGKKITRRILPKLSEAIGQEVILNDFTAGLLYLETMAYRREPYGIGFGAIKLLIPTPMGSDLLPLINTDEIRERNSCYLSAAVERNAHREWILASDIPEQIDRAGEQFRQAKKTIEGLTCHPNPDWVQLQKLQGLK